MKIYDCITYFEEEFLFELRLKILNNMLIILLFVNQFMATTE